ncbi:signal peptidase II Aspartic peptidase. MEROPS family A08 [Streptomyces sp. Ag82_O1-12]|uniref:signal peptidase II n=1 Tax=unclassified Streptomyces TaxID=2593676 RepID=UPI000BD49484|nr:MULTISPECIES: signal peptidase II [unclassified Streptomyces]SMQ15673.1 signal peptidase II Aspartic peptidase. MEROPS family A08 [Streptomyces sp. Ag82_O1-12]SOD44700.1 signal peptidase II Aspartic peptidase. MEROPS family A08 [Streptomyces sp. Ag82_G6-1]
MAEAERIIGTPDTPDAAGGGKERPDSEGTPAAGEPGAGPAAATGASGTGEAEATAAPPRGRRRIAVLFAVAAFAYALDLISKLIVVAKLEHHPPIEIVGDWLKFEAIRNAGAAFGFGEAFTVIFTMIAAAVIVVIARLARKLYSLPWAIALGLLLGGALGNLTDRIFRAPGVFEGAVVDFIAPKHFAVFNLADSAIVCGGILIVLLSFRGLDPDGTVHKD